MLNKFLQSQGRRVAVEASTNGSNVAHHSLGQITLLLNNTHSKNKGTVRPVKIKVQSDL